MIPTHTIPISPIKLGHSRYNPRPCTVRAGPLAHLTLTHYRPHADEYVAARRLAARRLAARRLAARDGLIWDLMYCSGLRACCAKLLLTYGDVRSWFIGTIWFCWYLRLRYSLDVVESCWRMRDSSALDKVLRRRVMSKVSWSVWRWTMKWIGPPVPLNEESKRNSYSELSMVSLATRPDKQDSWMERSSFPLRVRRHAVFRTRDWDMHYLMNDPANSWISYSTARWSWLPLSGG